MPSITYWNQLQPSPRAPSVAEGLAARVRDPAWALCRQWQLGEFQGADAGSPAFARVVSHGARLDAVGFGFGGATVPLAAGELLEPLVQSEPVGADLATRVELGQTFESLVSDELTGLFRGAYPIAAADAATDPAVARFLSVCAGRAVDGVALYAAARAAHGAGEALPAAPALDSTLQPAARQAISTFLEWVEVTWGAPADDEPPAWDAARLEYAATVSAGTLTLSASPDADAALDWYAFDLVSGTEPSSTQNATSVIPGHVRFRGMPNPRWWDFETSRTDFGAIIPDPRDLAKLLFADFLLLHGDDWLQASLDVPAGSLCWIDSLTVTDVFGVTTSIPRADALPGTRWTMFSTTDNASGSGPAPFLVVPSSAAASLLTSEPLEEVDLLRDETADMAWAVENVVEGPVGVVSVASPPSALPALDGPVPLGFRLASSVPANWFPLLPVATPGGAVALVVGGVEDGPRAPAGRFVRRLSDAGFALPEEEVSRAGLRLQRVACRTRAADGTARLWVARRRHIGAGEASSGLRYDTAEPTPD
jgi:hypothetical protein